MMEVVETKCGLIAFCGIPNAGKSTLLNALVGARIAPISSRPETTRRQIRGVLTEENTQFVFVDTPGVSDFEAGLRNYMAKQIQTAVEDVNLVAWITDASCTSGPVFENELARFEVFRKYVSPGTPMVLVLNKTDELQDRSMILPAMQKWQTVAEFKEMIPISAKKSRGFVELKSALAKYLPIQPFFFDSETLTDATERDIVSELIRESVVRLLSQELPYQTAVTIETFDEARRTAEKKPLVDIQAVIHVEKDSQKAIVIGHGGQKIKEIGEHSRRSVEKLLGVQVMLRLFVRVEEKWSKDKNALKKLGYK
jgi:GTP-binding protein Era